jgi:SPP1 family holin
MRDKIDIPSVTRSVVLLLALINQALTAAGKSPLPFSEDAVNECLTYCFTVGASLWAWWKNNNFTKEALEADAKLKELKLEKATSNKQVLTLQQSDAEPINFLLSIQVMPKQQNPSEQKGATS